MFIWFAVNRANYRKGQIFPFLIAALAILIIMGMITANIGKLSIFKTDVSNAADAGALAGASVLSGWLLSAGMISDTWCGTAVVTAARMMEIAVLGRDDIKIPSFSTDDSSNTTSTNNPDYQQFTDTLVGMIKLFIQHLIKFYLAYPRILEDSIMSWSNAKSAALRGAFSNAGVDEQPPLEWKNYDRQGKGAYDSYVNTYMSVDANQTGFSRFMSHPNSGFGNAWPNGITPGVLSDIMVTSGYGWTQNADESFSGSYPGNVNNYATYDNWVKVQVQGSVMWPVEALTFTEYFGDGVTGGLTAIVGVGSYLKYIGLMGGKGDKTVDGLKKVYGLGYLLAAVFAAVTAAAYLGMIKYMPSGLQFKDDEESLYTTKNPIVVQVTRFRKDQNLGMWNFQYGGGVHARSAAHAFRENNDITIKPVLVESIKDLNGLLGSVTDSVSDVDWNNPFGIMTLFQGMLCAGLAGGTSQSPIALKICDMEEKLCAKSYLENVLASWISFGPQAALMYMAYAALCQDDTVGLSPQSGDANMDTSGLMGIDTSEWFKTELHLFETELYPGYIE